MNTALLAIAKKTLVLLPAPDEVQRQGSDCGQRSHDEQPAKVGNGDEEPHAAAEEHVGLGARRPRRLPRARPSAQSG